MGDELVVTITSDSPLPEADRDATTQSLRQELLGIASVTVYPAVIGAPADSRSNMHLMVGVLGAALFTGRIGYRMFGEALHTWLERNKGKNVVVRLPDGTELSPAEVVEAAPPAAPAAAGVVDLTEAPVEKIVP